MRKDWITWSKFAEGYTSEDYLNHKLQGCLPQINKRDATFDELQQQFRDTLDEKTKLEAMRKSVKKEKLLWSWTHSFLNNYYAGGSRYAAEKRADHAI